MEVQTLLRSLRLTSRSQLHVGPFRHEAVGVAVPALSPCPQQSPRTPVHARKVSQPLAQCLRVPMSTGSCAVRHAPQGHRLLKTLLAFVSVFNPAGWFPRQEGSPGRLQGGVARPQHEPHAEAGALPVG